MKSSCPVKSCLLSVIGVFIFLMAYNFIVHHNLLMDDYRATASLWRNEDEMKNLGCWWVVVDALLAVIFTCFFKKFRKCAAACHCGPECACGPNCPCKTAVADKQSCCPIKSGGLCFGLKIGLIMGILMASTYIYMPIPSSLAIKWFFAYLIEGLGVGAVLGICSGIGSKSNCATNKTA